MTAEKPKWTVGELLRRTPITGRDQIQPLGDENIISMPPITWDRLAQEIVDRRANCVQIQIDAEQLEAARERYLADYAANSDALRRSYGEASEALMSAQERMAKRIRDLGIRSEVLPPPPLPENAERKR